MKFNKVIIVGGVPILLAGGLSIWQNSRPIQQAVQLKDMRSIKTALADIRRQIEGYGQRQIETQHILKRVPGSKTLPFISGRKAT